MSELTLNNHNNIAVNDRLRLRQFQVSEAPELFAMIDTHREQLGEWLPWVEQTTAIHDTIDFIVGTLRKREMVEEYNFGILVDNRIAGDVNLADKGNGTAEIGYWLVEEMTHQGIMTEAVTALRDFSTDELGLKKLRIRANAGNIGSQRVAEKAGFIKTGEYVNEEDFRKGETTYIYEYTKNEQANRPE